MIGHKPSHSGEEGVHAVLTDISPRLNRWATQCCIYYWFNSEYPPPAPRVPRGGGGQDLAKSYSPLLGSRDLTEAGDEGPVTHMVPGAEGGRYYSWAWGPRPILNLGVEGGHF